MLPMSAHPAHAPNLPHVLALLPVRHGALPAGALDTAAECGWRSLLVGSGTVVAARELPGDVRCCEFGDYRPGAWAAALAPLLAAEARVVLPASPDGRDLAPRLAAVLGRPLFAGATEVASDHVVVARGGGLSMHTLPTPPRLVATLQVGVRGADDGPPHAAPVAVEFDDEHVLSALDSVADARLVRTVDPDPATIDLAEATRIVGGGAGLSSPEQFDRLAAVGAALGASVGATRVITDRGWVPHERQIGTTGVVVSPQLYLAFGVSGAVQHTSGLGHPDHVISVNTDAHCPMMQLADLAVVADANEVLTHLVDLLDPAEHTTVQHG